MRKVRSEPPAGKDAADKRSVAAPRALQTVKRSRLDLRAFARHVEASRRRIEHLAKPAVLPPPAAETLEELRQNVAELEAAEAELIEQHEHALAMHERYRELFESAPGGYLATDAGAMITEINRAGRALLTLNPGWERKAKPLAALVDPQDRLDFRRRVSRLAKGDTAGAQWECWMRPLGGRARFRALLSVTPVKRGARVSALRWLIQDVTEGYLAQKAVRDLSRRLLRAQDEERRRIATEIHDVSGPILSTLGMLLASTQTVPRTPRKVRLAIEEARRLVDDYSKQVRSVSYLLYPPTLDESGLAATLRWYVKGLRERSNVAIDLKVPRDLGRLPADVERTLYRITQEALANALRHSGSRLAAIRLNLERGVVTLVVEDQGRGMGRDRGKHSWGLGLRSIRDRVAELGGSLAIRSGQKGTKLTATLPLAEQGAHGLSGAGQAFVAPPPP